MTLDAGAIRWTEHVCQLKWGRKMARRGRTSIVREVKESLDSIDKIGQSKRDAKKVGGSGIHSFKQKENTLSDCQNFVKWCRSVHGVKSISELNKGYYMKYIQYLNDKGISRGHQQNVETSLRLLEKGFKKRSERFDDSSGSFRFKGFCPEKRLVNIKTGENVKNRAYLKQEVQVIRENCSLEVRKAVDLMHEIGLRVKEAANVRVEHFNKQDSKWYLKIDDGAGITKGGRFRKLEIPMKFEKRMEQMITNKKPNECLVRVSTTTIRDGVNIACKKAGIIQNGRGTHGFRHAYARRRMAELASSDQMQMMERILTNRSVGRKADYGILSERDKVVFSETKSIMDKIHSELGHGKNRWELAMRYLR